MQYMTGDIWELAEREHGWIVVPTNTTVRKNGNAVMEEGIAKAVALKYPEIPMLLGTHIPVFKGKLFICRPVICLPTKDNWRHPSKIEWIKRGCEELIDLAETLASVGNKVPIFLPPLGDGLNWEKRVHPIVSKILSDDRFVLVQPQ